MTEDEMVGWHHRLDGHGFGWTPGVGDGQGGLACCGHGVAQSRTQLKQLSSSSIIPLNFEVSLHGDGPPWWLSGKKSTCQYRRCREDPLEKLMATHSSILAWEIPWTEEPGGLQSMGV